MLENNELKTQIEFKENCLLLCKKYIEQSLEEKSKLEDNITFRLQRISGDGKRFLLKEIKDTEDNIKGLKPVIITKSGYEDDAEEGLGSGLLFAASQEFHSNLLVLNGNTNRIQVLDEPFAHAKENIIPMLWKNMEDMCENLDIQMIVVTHSQPYGKVYIVEEVTDNHSRVREIPSEF